MSSVSVLRDYFFSSEEQMFEWAGMWDVAWALLLALSVIVCWLLNLLSAPGNWLIIIVAAAYAYWGPDDSPADMGWYVVLALVVLAALGELAEFLAGALGAKRVGGSKRGAALALVGSILGALLGVIIGVPIPVVGQLVAALLFASLGAMGGAMLGEHWKGKDMEHGWEVGKAAFIGRLLGTLGKFLFGAVMVGLVIGALVI